MLFQELGKVKRTWIMKSIIMIVIGIVMMMCPVSYLGMLVSFVGYLLLVGATVMVLDFMSSKKVLVNYISLTGGLIAGLLGFFVLLQRLEILPMLGLLFGLILILEGISDLLNAFLYARRAGSTAWGVLAFLSAMTILFGLLILFNPWWHSPEGLKQVIGIMLLFSSVVSIVRVVLTWPFKDE
jgi:uncharacterized membrane protein HdeD (DUF308 family)